MREIVAKRYAKALIEIGRDDGQYERHGLDLKAFEEVLEASPELRAVLENPIYNKEQKKSLFHALRGKLDLSPVIVNFVLLLIDKRRLAYYEEIVRCYERLADEVAGRKRAKVIAAVPLADPTLEAIQRQLASMTGKEVIVSVHQDSDLIGGVVTQIGDVIYDGSIRTQLEKIREALVKG